MDQDEHARIDMFREVLAEYHCTLEVGPRIEAISTHCKAVLQSVDADSDLVVFASQHGTGQCIFMPDTEGIFSFPVAMNEVVQGPPMGGLPPTRTAPAAIPNPPTAPPLPSIGPALTLVLDGTSPSGKPRYLTNSAAAGISPARSAPAPPGGDSGGKRLSSAAAIHAAAAGSFRKKKAAGEAAVGFKEVPGAIGRKGSASAPPSRPTSKHVAFADEYQALYEHVGGLHADADDFSKISDVFPAGGTVYALYDYTANNSDELSFAFDDAFTVQAQQREAEPGWLTVRDDGGKEGIVPANYFEADDGDASDDEQPAGGSGGGGGGSGGGGEEVYNNADYNDGYPTTSNF